MWLSPASAKLGCVLRPRLVVVLAVAAIAGTAAAQAAHGGGSAGAQLRIVALGDSDTTGSGDPTGAGWVGRYGRLLHQRLGIETRVTNLAVDGTTSSRLLAAARSNSAMRRTIAAADVVLIGIGGADLNAGDDRWQSGSCRGKACYAADLRAFARNLEATVATVAKLRRGKKTVLRAITLPNALTGAEDAIPGFLKPVATSIGVFQSNALRRAICASMTRHAGRCVDVYRVFNGANGRANAYKKGLLNHTDCCYPSAMGQQLIAELLLRTGLKPVR